MSSAPAATTATPTPAEAFRAGVRRAAGFGVRAAAAGAMSAVFLVMPSVKGVE